MNNSLITIIINASNNCSKVQVDDNGFIVEPIIATQPVPGQSYEMNQTEESHVENSSDQRGSRSSPKHNQSYVPLVNPTFNKKSGSMYSFKFKNCNHGDLTKDCKSSITQIPKTVVEKYVDKTVDQSDLSIAAVPGQDKIPLLDLATDESLGAVYVFRIVKCIDKTANGCKNVIIAIPQKVAESYVVARNVLQIKECNQINGAGCFSKAQVKCVQDCHDAHPMQTQDCRMIDGVSGCFSDTILPCVTRCFSSPEAKNQTSQKRRQ